MMRPSPSSFGLNALRRDRGPFALLGALLLTVQLFIAGFTGGAMAATSGGIICVGGGKTVAAPGGGDHRRDHRAECPCLAGACCQPAALASPAEPAASVPRPIAATASRPLRIVEDGPDTRPLSLFARAGRSPPPLA